MTGRKRCYSLADCYAGSDDRKDDSASTHFKTHNFFMRCCNSCFACLVLIVSQPRVMTQCCPQSCGGKAWYLTELCGSPMGLMEKTKFRNAVSDAMAVPFLFLLSVHHAVSVEEPWPAGRAAWLMASILFG